MEFPGDAAGDYASQRAHSAVGGQRRSRGPAQPGQRVEIELLPVETKAGSVSCTGRLRLAAADGTEGELPLSFQVQVPSEQAAMLAHLVHSR